MAEEIFSCSEEIKNQNSALIQNNFSSNETTKLHSS